MFERLKMGKKFHIINLAKLQEIRRRGRYIKYYVRPVRNGRNDLAKSIDFFVFMAAALVITFLIMAEYTKSPERALLYTIPVIIPGYFLALGIKKSLERERLAHQKLWLAGRLCQERIRAMGSAEKLAVLLAEILEKLPGFSDVHLLRENTDNIDQNISMNLRALRRGTPVLVGCLMPGKGEDQTAADEVLIFAKEIKRLNMREGILVAAGKFSAEARRAAREGKKNIALVDLYRLVELSRLTGHDIFPTGLLPDSEGPAGKRRVMYLRLFRNAFAKEKARGYFISAGVITALYCTVVSPGLPGVMYLFFGVVNLFLALYCIAFNRETDLLDTPGGKS